MLCVVHNYGGCTTKQTPKQIWIFAIFFEDTLKFNNCHIESSYGVKSSRYIPIHLAFSNNTTSAHKVVINSWHFNVTNNAIKHLMYKIDIEQPPSMHSSKNCLA